MFSTLFKSSLGIFRHRRITTVTSQCLTRSLLLSSRRRPLIDMEPTQPCLAAPMASFSTRIIPMDLSKISVHHTDSSLSHLSVSISPDSVEASNLALAAAAIKGSIVPVAFPTETVYGLGADATRSSAVKGIYKAKNRPSDNPLIVHISSLSQLAKLLSPAAESGSDSIPAIYEPLIKAFWPGPLTILLPISKDGDSIQTLAPEVSASLSTFGARMPASPLALALIHLADRPLAAPSANASTRPSPTSAAHVLHDLNGRIEFILDGGDCQVGVESTVVDGLSSPPAVLRPGGISLDAIRRIPGWSQCIKAYKDEAEGGTGKAKPNGQNRERETAPRAPGMKYKHYSPSAKVVLVKSGVADVTTLRQWVEKALLGGYNKIGILQGPQWRTIGSTPEPSEDKEGFHLRQVAMSPKELTQSSNTSTSIIEASLGRTAEAMARNLFRGLREMDLQQADLIFVEGAEDERGDEAAAAVMNRLRKAAEIKINTLDEISF